VSGTDAIPDAHVVIAAYNAEGWLARAVESALALAFVRSVVVVDDGSAVEAAGVLAGIDDGRVRTVRQENAGPSVARNRGLDDVAGELSAGAFVVLLDADDELLDGVGAALVDAAGSGAAVLAMGREEVDEAGRLLKVRLPDDDLPRGAPLRPGVAHRPNGLWTATGLIVSESAVRGGARFAADLVVVEDIDFVRRCCAHGPLVVSEAVGLRRRNSTTGSNLTGRGRYGVRVESVVRLYERWYDAEDDAAWRATFAWLLNQVSKHGPKSAAAALRRVQRERGWRTPVKVRARLAMLRDDARG